MAVMFVSCTNSTNSHRLIGPHTSCVSSRLYLLRILKPPHNISVQRLSTFPPASAFLPVARFCALFYQDNNLYQKLYIENIFMSESNWLPPSGFVFLFLHTSQPVSLEKVKFSPSLLLPAIWISPAVSRLASHYSHFSPVLLFACINNAAVSPVGPLLRLTGLFPITPPDFLVMISDTSTLARGVQQREVERRVGEGVKREGRANK